MADKTDDLVIGISTDLTTIKRQLRSLGQIVTRETDSYGKSFEKAGAKIDRSMRPLQDTINRVTGVMVSSGREWQGALAQPSRQLDELRQKFIPLYAETKKYEAELAELNRAQAIGALSASEHATALASLNAKFQAISPNAAVAARLAAEIQSLTLKFDPLAAAAAKYQAALAEVARAEQLGAINAERAIQVRLKLTNAYNAQVTALERVATAQKMAAQSMVNKATITPNRGADIAAYGKELERLRAQYNPIFAAVKQYQLAIAEIRQSNAVGAISTDEMTAAIQRERQATLSSIAAIKQRNAATRLTRVGGAGNVGNFNTANIAAQFQDIGVTAAMGMNPLQIALQQGTQLSLVLEQMKGTGQSTGRALLGAFTAIISPISLVTIGLVAAGAAAAQYFFSTSEKAKKLDDVLSEHAKAVSELRKAYGIAGDAAEDFGRKSTAAMESAARSSAAALRAAIETEEKNVKSGLSDSGGFSGFGLLQRIGLLGGDDLKAVKLQFAAFAEPINKLRQQIKEGKPDYDAFQQSLAAIVATDPKNLQPIADKIQLIISKAADGRGELDSMSDALDQITTLQFDTARIVTQMGNIETAAKNAQGAAGEFLKMLAHIDQIASGIDAKGDRLGGKGAMDAAQEQFNQQLNLFRRFGYGEDSRIERDSTKPLKKPHRTPIPRRTADDRFSEDIKAIQARTQALAMERGLLGATYEEQIKRNTAFDLEQKALKEVREEARRKGYQDWQNAQLSEDQKKKIDEVSDAYARQADELRKAREAMQLESDILHGVFGDLRNALEDGKITTQEWGNIFLNVLDKIIDKIEDELVTSLLQLGNSSGGGGGGLLNLITGGITSLFGGGGGSYGSYGAGVTGDPWAGLRFANGTNYAPGGVALVGERGPELMNVPRGAQIIPNDILRRGISMPTIKSGGGTSNTHVTVGVSVDNNGNLQAYVKNVSQQAAGAAVSSFSAHALPGRVKQINADPRKRG